MNPVPQREHYRMVNLQPHKVLLVLPVKDVVSAVLVGHHLVAALAHLVQHTEQLLPSKLLTFRIPQRHLAVNTTGRTLLHTDDRSL